MVKNAKMGFGFKSFISPRSLRLCGEMVCLCLFFLTVLPASARPNRAVVGYSASWFDGIYPAESYNYDAFTHICRAFLVPKPNGDITASGDFWNADLERMAHAHKVKLLASLGGAAPDANHWLAMARDTKAQTHFFDELEKMITAHNYDGVDIDWEPSALTDADQVTYTKFMQDLRKRFPKWIITTALGGGDWWAKHVSWLDICKEVDFINLMTYDFSGVWTEHSGHNANLYNPSDSRVDSGLSIDEMVKRLEHKYNVPSGKIVLGLPFYGVQFFTKDMGTRFTDEASKVTSQIQYYEVAGLLAGKDFNQKWDDGAQVPYLEKKGGNHVISYDDARSIGLKCQYAVKEDLLGVMVWNLGADVVANRTPLLDSICKEMAAGARSMPAEGLFKTVQTFTSMVKESFNKLNAAKDKLSAAGKAEDAKAADPGTLPDFNTPDGAKANILGEKLFELQRALSSLNVKLAGVQTALDSIPVPNVEGKKLPAKGNSLLIDDFESGGTSNPLGGNWMTDTDHNNLGTVMYPIPFKPGAGGSKDSPKFGAHIFGHYGKSIAPWPYAMLTGTLGPTQGQAVDLSDFKTIQFWAKGDGKDYSVVLARAAIQDYANPRNDFKAQAGWTKVILNLADFKQPTWGRQVPPKVSDILYFSFTPAATFSDEDFNLWVDDVTLVK